MASLTTILGLRKPAGTDIVNVVTDISDNMQKIDDAFGSYMPLGVMLPYTGATAPADPKWILANGALVSTATYPDYFALVGHKYNGGADPGGGQFRMPSITDKILRGVGTIPDGTTTPAGSHTHAKTGSVQAANATHGHGTGGQIGNHAHHGNTGGASYAHLHVNTAFGAGQYSGTPDADHGHGFDTGGSDADHSHGVNNDNASHNHTDTVSYAGAFTGDVLGINYIVKVKK